MMPSMTPSGPHPCPIYGVPVVKRVRIGPARRYCSEACRRHRDRRHEPSRQPGKTHLVHATPARIAGPSAPTCTCAVPITRVEGDRLACQTCGYLLAADLAWP